MKILAFDTSSTTCFVGLLNTDHPAGKIVQSLHKTLPMQQGKLILPLIKQLLEESHLTLNQLDAIAYSAGPGSFTGIRIANSVAQGIGFAVKLPIIQVSSLAVMAEAAYLEKKLDHCLVAVDARMEKIYWAMYQRGANNNVALVGREELCAPELIKLSEQINVTNWSGIGDGWQKYGAVLSKQLGGAPHTIVATQLPSAEALLMLAKVKFENKDWVTAECASPVYL